MTLSIDANFGLCPKRAAGKGVHPPLSGTNMFFSEEEVDIYVSRYVSHPSHIADVSDDFLNAHISLSAMCVHP